MSYGNNQIISQILWSAILKLLQGTFHVLVLLILIEFSAGFCYISAAPRTAEHTHIHTHTQFPLFCLPTRCLMRFHLMDMDYISVFVAFMSSSVVDDMLLCYLYMNIYCRNSKPNRSQNIR